MGKASKQKRKAYPEPEKKYLEPIRVKTAFLFNPVFHIFLIIVLSLLVYSNTFHVPFQFDDKTNIVENPLVKDLKYFTTPSQLLPVKLDFWYEGFKRRLVGHFTFALNYRLHGLDVTGYHVFNLIVHLANALLVYWLVVLTLKIMVFSYHTGEDRWSHRYAHNFIALFAALLFVSHPIQTQAVTYIVQRFTSLATLFYVFSLLMYIKARLSESSTRRYAFFAASIISAILSMKTKEIAFTLPVVITLYEFMFFTGEIKRRVLYLIPVLLTMVVIPLSFIDVNRPIGSMIGEMGESTKVQTTMSRWDYLFTQFRVIVTYIRLLLLPVNQNLDYDYPVYHSFFEPGVMLSFLFLVSIMGLGIYVLYRYRDRAPHTRLISFGIFWFFITMSVESSIIPIVDVIFEHRVYLPSLGLFIAFVSAVEEMRERIGDRIVFIRRAVIYGMVLVVVSLSATAYARNAVWQGKEKLWEDVVRKSPHKARPHNNLGMLYYNRGRIDEATKEYQTALALKPDYPEAHNNLGNTHVMQGRIAEAIKEYQTALRLNPDYAEAHYNLGKVYHDQKRIDEAIKEYQAALALKPDYPEAHNNLGFAYVRQGRIDEAIKECQTALSLKPHYPEAHNNLGFAYFKQGRIEEAIKEFQTALKLNANYASARNNLEILYKMQGNRQKQ
jgi:Flp pilus assembly protein TadD